MALEQIHLRKLLKLLFLDSNILRSEIRKDIREDIRREAAVDSAGGDFYGPFWFDAKKHVFEHSDLYDMVEDRIARNPRRRNLYPQLRDGFLSWWNEGRRWTNEPFQPGQTMKAHLPFTNLDAVVKIDSILTVRDGLGDEYAVYPYFAPDPVLSEFAARLGLWILTNALPEVPSDEIRILDVIRGRTFSLDRTPLQGDEEEEFLRRYDQLLRRRDELLTEYENWRFSH